MRTLGILLWLGALSALALAQAPELNPSITDWRSDIDDVVRDIRTLHPDPFAKTGHLVFLRAVNQLKDDLPRLSEEQRMVRLMHIVALVGDGHTQLEPASARFASWYPIRIYQFSDGYFVTSAHKSVADLAGAQVLEIAGRPAHEVIEAARNLMGDENAFDRKERLFPAMNAGMMKGLGFAGADGSLKARFRLRNGQTTERTLTARATDDPDYKGLESSFEWQFLGEMFGMPFDTPKDWVSAFHDLPAEAFRTEDFSRPPHLFYRRAYVAHALPEQHAYYLQLNQVDDTKFVPFIENALKQIDEQKPQRVIIDLRYNFGGDGSKVRDVVHDFIKREDHKPWKELYVLTGRKTFSAGVGFLTEFTQNTQSALVGEPAGAAVNSHGDPTERKYPRTGLSLNVSTVRYPKSASDDLRPIIPVDVPAYFSFTQYVAGQDPAVDPILRGEEMRSIIQIALADGGAAAHKAYLDRKRRFGDDPAWAAPTEFELRNACNQLQDEKRFDDAVDTCRMSTEVHPEIWNSWYNLGEALIAAGRRADSVEDFACVLKIDPLNWNSREIRSIIAEFHADPDKVPAGCAR